MPASRSTSRDPRAQPRKAGTTAGKSRVPVAPVTRRRWPWVLLALLVIIFIACSVLPASLIARALPAQVHAEDFSGSVWHGSAGRLLYGGRDIGAIEWHLHPAALLSLTVSADLHWVKLGSVLDGSVEATSSSLTARNVKGSGSIDDLHDLGIAPSWHGSASVALSVLRTDFKSINSAVGTVSVSGLSSTQVANGAELGSYEAHLGAEPASPDGTLNVDLNDAGGPIELTAMIHVPQGTRTALLSGFIRERPDAAPALKDQIASLAQLRPRDSAGRIPIELEYSL